MGIFTKKGEEQGATAPTQSAWRPGSQDKKASYSKFETIPLSGKDNTPPPQATPPSAGATDLAASYRERLAVSRSFNQSLETESKKKLKPSPSRSTESTTPKKVRRCGPARMWVLTLCVLQILVAAGVIGVIAGCLSETEVITNPTDNLSVATTTCYATTKDVQVCFYGYWVAVISVILSLLLMVFQCFYPSRTNACCISMEAIVGLIGLGWWLAAGITETIYAQEANDMGLPKEGCRTASWALSYANAGLFLLTALTSLVDGFALCCCRDRDLDF